MARAGPDAYLSPFAPVFFLRKMTGRKKVKRALGANFKGVERTKNFSIGTKWHFEKPISSRCSRSYVKPGQNRRVKMGFEAKTEPRQGFYNDLIYPAR
jgi:hypothetical protein